MTKSFIHLGKKVVTNLPGPYSFRNYSLLYISTFVLIMLVVGCQGETGEKEPGVGSIPGDGLNGTSSVAAFSETVYPLGRRHCALCHSDNGDPLIMFAHSSVDQAHAEITNNGAINLSSPPSSLVVSKLQNNHFCWSGNCVNDSAEMQLAIKTWADKLNTASPDNGTTAPPIVSGSGNSFAFSQTVYPILLQRCGACHSGAGPGTPDISHADLETAYAATVNRQKVDLSTPEKSRIVVRMLEFHNCWSDCVQNANEIKAAVDKWITLEAGSDQVPPVKDFIVSVSASLADAKNISVQRHETDVIAKYEFKTGSGNTAVDTSGVSPALDLTLTGTTWVSGQGIIITNTAGAMAIASDTNNRKLFDLIAAPNTGSKQFSVEAWVIVADSAQDAPGGARIVSYSAGTRDRNFSMTQSMQNLRFRNRSSTTGSNGNPALITTGNVVSESLMHIVMTYTPQTGRRVYVNGIFTGDQDTEAPGNIDTWNPGYRFLLGNETSENRLWQGQISLVAIHNQALTDAQVLQNYSAGVGSKSILSFDISQPLSLPGSAIQFEVSELDDYSYVFTNPVFVGANASNIPIKGIRIGVNQSVPVSGQSFRNVDVVINQSGQEISRLGSIITKANGPAQDRFFITFDTLGNLEKVFVEPVIGIPPLDNTTVETPKAGIKTFEQINNTMAALTGVDPLSPAVLDTYNTVKQQLPGSSNIAGFLSSNQVGISKLALEYCDSFVESAVLRNVFFGNSPAFEFESDVVTAFSNQAKKELIVDSLISHMMGSNILNLPTPAELKTELISLINDLTVSCTTPAQCGATRTKTVVKVSCTAILASAATLIQ